MKPQPRTTVGEAIGDLPEPHYEKRSRKQINLETAQEHAEILGREWDEAVIVEAPRKFKDAAIPRVLVRRKLPAFTNPDGSELVYFDGNPAISLFTGCGGFDLGMEWAGFIPVVQHEWDDSCCWTLLANRPQCFRNSALIQGDIYKTPTEMLLAAGGLRVGECHLLTGGPPCQGFSVMGLRNPKDERNDLIFQFLRVVREAQPKFFIMENVAGLLTKPNREYFERFLAMAYGCFYELVYGLVDCVEYGVPQYRCRFICAGTRRDMFAIDGILSTLPAPTCFSNQDLANISFLEGALSQKDLPLYVFGTPYHFCFIEVVEHEHGYAPVHDPFNRLPQVEALYEQPLRVTKIMGKLYTGYAHPHGS